MDMETEQVILTRGLPKTGEIITEPEGCDGFYQAGWWQGQKEPRTRFVAKTIGDNGDKVVIDLATGLTWAVDGNAGGCNNGNLANWTVTFTYVNALDFAGFTDWRMPNINELVSITDFSINSPSIQEPPFENTYSAFYWSSTTYSIIDANVLIVNFATGVMGTLQKFAEARIRCVRGGV